MTRLPMISGINLQSKTIFLSHFLRGNRTEQKAMRGGDCIAVHGQQKERYHLTVGHSCECVLAPCACVHACVQHVQSTPHGGLHF